MADKYFLRVTAGPSYDPATHHSVAVNGPNSTHISSENCIANIKVRIQNYRGLPLGSPKTSPYFSSAPHTHDQYSIAFTIVLHRDVPGNSLVFGNDFDRPVRDRLPPGFGAALKIVKWAIDPGLDGDVYADEPYLYGNALSSVNLLNIGEKVGKEIPAYINEDGIREGSEGKGEELRKEKHVPEDADKRKKWFLDAKHKEDWVWEEGRVYQGDFFNPYLNFNDFTLKLPGFSMSVLPYLGGQDFLRYVLKNKVTGDVFFVVVFHLVPKEEVEKEDATDSETKGQKRAGEASFQPKDDDLD